MIVIGDSSDEDEGKRMKRERKSKKVARERKENEEKENDEAFAATWRQAEEAEQSGYSDCAVNYLMSAIEINVSDKFREMKMKAHKKIAELSNELGWLHE